MRNFFLHCRPYEIIQLLSESRSHIRKELRNACQKEACAAIYAMCCDLQDVSSPILAQIILSKWLPPEISIEEIHQFIYNIHSTTIEQNIHAFAKIWQKYAPLTDSRSMSTQTHINVNAFKTKCSVDVFIHKTRIYAILNGNDVAKRTFANQPHIFLYDYSEDETKPENVSYQEWNARKRVWKQIIHEHIIQGALSYEISTDTIPIGAIDDNLLDSMIPQLIEQNTKRIAAEKLICNKPSINLTSEKSRIHRMMNDCTDEKINACMQEIRKTLPDKAYLCDEILRKNF